jgi:predicted RNA binding protein YcfA (HicA-like mRNA interferase family)
MPRLAPTDWGTLVALFKKDGFVEDRSSGSHIALCKPGILRPIIIPRYSAVGIDIIKNNMRTAGMSRDRYFKLLAKVK